MYMVRIYDMYFQYVWVYYNGQDVKKYQGVKNRFDDIDVFLRYYVFIVL